MQRAGWLLLGALGMLLVLALGGFITLQSAQGFSAREKPGAFERWAAGWARGAAMPSDAKVRQNPVANNAEVIEEARAHWADHCASCHANDGSGDTEMGKNMYPPPPDMRLAHTQQMTDGELFYVIRNGVRLTGMPGWGATEGDDIDSWKLVHFIRHLPKLSPDEVQSMKKLNPKSPDEFREEEEEERFLRGEDVSETPATHHHH